MAKTPPPKPTPTKSSKPTAKQIANAIRKVEDDALASAVRGPAIRPPLTKEQINRARGGGFS